MSFQTRTALFQKATQIFLLLAIVSCQVQIGKVLERAFREGKSYDQKFVATLHEN